MSDNVIPFRPRNARELSDELRDARARHAAATDAVAALSGASDEAVLLAEATLIHAKARLDIAELWDRYLRGGGA